MENIIEIIKKCSVEASKLYVYLSKNIPEGLELDPLNDGKFCFRIGGFNPNNGFDKVSISYPPDAMGNRGAPYDGPIPNTIEIALVKDGEFVYIDSIAYNDVRRFDFYEEILEELERLK
jgi:hypothetical protein